MHKAQEQVREFQAVAGDGLQSPAEPMIRAGELRARLILEEAIETAVALVGGPRAKELAIEFAYSAGWDPPSLVDAIDGVCDLLYVAYGTAEAIGVDLEPHFDAVHAANMAKVDGPIDEHGKRRKPPGWTPPNHTAVLDMQRRKRLGVGEPPPPIEKY